MIVVKRKHLKSACNMMISNEYQLFRFWLMFTSAVDDSEET